MRACFFRQEEWENSTSDNFFILIFFVVYDIFEKLGSLMIEERNG